MGMGWRSQHELIMCGTRENAMWSKYMGAQGNVITLRREPNLEHPTMELRNLYGTGHGRDGRFIGLKPRHAKLAVGAAATLGTFLLETHLERTLEEPTSK